MWRWVLAGESRKGGGGSNTEQSRPSSSGGRLEQHLGAVDSAEIPSLPVMVPSAPAVSRAVGFPAGPRIGTITSVAAKNIRGALDGPGRGVGGRNSGTQADNSRSFRGGGDAGVGSSAISRAVDEQPPLTRRPSDVGQAIGGRRARDRKGGGGGGGGRKRSTSDFVVGGVTSGTDAAAGPAKGGAGRGKADGGGRTRPRRVASQVSFGSSTGEGGCGGGDGCYGGDRGGGGGGRRGEAGERGGRSESGTEDHKFRMQAGQSNTLVAVRLRPLLKHDREQVEVAKVLDNRVVVLMDPAKINQEVDPLRVNRTREKRYAFDYVFDASATQRAVYENTTKFLIQGVLDGFNATVFAYGCTGAGKTYTMIGNDQEGHQGIMVLTLQDLFKQQYRASEAQGRRYSVTVSFLEVYNENIRDLLNDTGDFLDLREDPIKGPTVSGLAEVEARTPEDIMGLLRQGNLSRTQQATRANAVSSRSHAVLQVVVESRDIAPGTVARTHVGKLSLVDLAGSERAAATQNRGVRLVEGANINRSLLALGNCINALGERGNKGQFVPYRDSKLTRLLKDSLGGNCRTVMIANISGASSSFEETLNTLKYANRAKNIKTNATRNSLDVNHHISEYVNLIGSLRTEITRLKHQLVRGARGGQGSGGDSAGTIRPEARSHDSRPASVDRERRRRETSSLDGGHREGGLHGTNDDETGLLMVPPPTNRPLGGGDAGSGSGSAAASATKIVGSTKASSKSAVSPSSSVAALDVGDVVSSSRDRDRDRDYFEEVREKIVENFRERMQLRRSLIELEDQNVQNSIEVGKRQLSLVEWHGGRRLPQEAAAEALQGLERDGGWAEAVAEAAQAAAAGRGVRKAVGGDAPPSPPAAVREAWRECEQLCAAISKNNETKRKISRRLRNNSRQAESFKADLDGKITGEDRDQLMKLQYRIGKLEVDNMELEQSRIVHESAMRGKDLTIQKLQLQLSVRDRSIALQQSVLTEHGLNGCAGFPDAIGIEQVGVGDALDAFLPEGGAVAGNASGIESGGSYRSNSNVYDNHGVLILGDGGDGGGGAAGIGGRRGGWGSSSDSDQNGGSFTERVHEANGDSVSTTAAVGGIDGVSRGGGGGGVEGRDDSASNLSQAPPPPLAEAERKQRQRKETSRIDRLRDTVIEGATNTYTTSLVSTRQRPRRRPSKATGRTSRAHQPPPPLLSSQWKQKQAVPRRRRHPSDSEIGGGLAPGDGHDEDAAEDSLVSSVVLASKYAGDANAREVNLGNGEQDPDNSDASGGGVERAGAGTSSGQPPGQQTTSAALAPFHGPLPAPLAFDNNSGSEKKSMVGQGGRDASAGGGGRGSEDAVAAKDVPNDSFLTTGGTTIVVGIPAKHRRTHAKVFQQQQRSLGEKQKQQQQQQQQPQHLQLQLLQQQQKQQQEQQLQQHRTQQQQQRLSTKGASGDGISANPVPVPVVVPFTTWNDATRGRELEGGGEGLKGRFSGDVALDDNASGGGDTDEDSVLLPTGKNRVAACFCSQGGGGSSGGRGNAGTKEFESLKHASEQQRRAPRTEHLTATATTYRDYHAQPPLPLKLEVAPVPLNSSSAASIDTATQQAAASTSSAVGVIAGGHDTSSPGAGMTLPWRDSRRQGPIPFPASGAGKAGTNRRRLRREQARGTGASAAGSDSGATRRSSGWRWGGDGGGGGGGGASGGPRPSAAGVPKNAIGGGAAKNADGGNNGSSGSGVIETHSLNHASPVVFPEWGERSLENANSGGGDTGLQGFTGLDRAVGSPAATTTATTTANSGGTTFLVAPGVAGESDTGGENGARSGAGNSKAGWRAAGGSLANLKARMGARYQQHPAVPRERGFSAGRERSAAVHRGDREREGRAQPIAYQAF